MRKRTENNSNGNFFTDEALVAHYNLVKKTITEYTEELTQHFFFSGYSQTGEIVVANEFIP